MKSPLVSYVNPEPFRYDNYVLRRFLQLPLFSLEIKQLAESLSNSGDSSFEKANNILNYLKTGFGYSLEMVKKTELSGLDEFLFIRKRGHCEYFASAMAVLLRLQGVPNKLVNDFVSSEWNDLGNYMVVRHKHAHWGAKPIFLGTDGGFMIPLLQTHRRFFKRVICFLLTLMFFGLIGNAMLFVILLKTRYA